MSLANFRIVIPARIGSTRLPRKPLSMLNGKPMIAHTIENAMQTGARVYVATDDPDIAQVADQIGAGVFMSIEDHNSGTERVAEVARVMRWEDDSIVVNLQGDEPTMPAVNIAQVAASLGVSGYEMATLCVRLESEAEHLSPNVVKVVRREDGRALYFSRAAIGSADGLWPGGGVDRHVGIYGYRVRTLDVLVNRYQACIEQNEKLEQLRALSFGMEIGCYDAIANVGPSVDTVEDLFAAEAWIGANADKSDDAAGNL